jgi:hypothetical protein
MPQLNPASAENRIATHFAADLLYAQFLKQAVTTGRVLVPPFPDPHHATKHRLEDVPHFPGGIRQELAQAAIEEANEQLVDWLKHVFGSIWGSGPAPKPHLPNIIVNTSLTFDDPIPVNCSASLTLFPDGAYNFSGHFHDSGAPSYDAALVLVVASTAGTAFVFKHTGRLHGTFEPGSRDDDWNDAAVNAAIADAWDDLSVGYHWQCTASVNMDLQQLIDAAVKGVGTVTKIVAIVG